MSWVLLFGCCLSSLEILVLLDDNESTFCISLFVHTRNRRNKDYCVSETLFSLVNSSLNKSGSPLNRDPFDTADRQGWLLLCFYHWGNCCCMASDVIPRTRMVIDDFRLVSVFVFIGASD